MLVRDNHEMAAVVREQVHDEETVLPPPDHEILPILFLLRYPTEEASFAGLCTSEGINVGGTPWRV